MRSYHIYLCHTNTDFDQTIFIIYQLPVKEVIDVHPGCCFYALQANKNRKKLQNITIQNTIHTYTKKNRWVWSLETLTHCQ